jgi:hypothetical protein
MSRAPFSLSVALATVLSAATAAEATEVFNDTFDKGNDPIGHYFTRKKDTTLTVVDDSKGLGSGNALRVQTGSNFSPFLREFYNDPISLTTDTRIVLNFDFRFLNVVNAPMNFRFGLYNSHGTKTKANNDNSSDDDNGYGVLYGTGQNRGYAYTKEFGMRDTILNGNDVKELASGDAVKIDDTKKHHFEFRITRERVDEKTVTEEVFALDGKFYAVAGDNKDLILGFDEVAFSVGTAKYDFLLDNVRVDFERVPGTPEPPTAVLVLTGCVAIAAWSLLRRNGNDGGP